MSWLIALADRASASLGFLSRVVNAIGTLVVLGLVVVVNFDVVARGVFNTPFRGTVEVVQFSMVLIVFLQLPDVVRSGRLTRSDGLLTILANQQSRFGDVLKRLIDLLSATLMVLVAVTMWPEFTEAWETNDYFGTPGIFTAPWWPVKLVIFLSAVLCSLLWLCKVFASTTSSPEKLKDEP
ncbi:MAG: TRAP transporter small permease subunit [Hyphomicrobiaceae bacterium]